MLWNALDTVTHLLTLYFSFNFQIEFHFQFCVNSHTVLGDLSAVQTYMNCT